MMLPESAEDAKKKVGLDVPDPAEDQTEGESKDPALDSHVGQACELEDDPGAHLEIADCLDPDPELAGCLDEPMEMNDHGLLQDDNEQEIMDGMPDNAQ